MERRRRLIWLLGVVVQLTASAAAAQDASQRPYTLKQAFEDAWGRQPEAAAMDARRQAAEARKRVSESWSAEPAAIEVSARSDRFNGNEGAREYQAGVAIPLWLSGERSRSAAVADAELAALDSRIGAARFRVAGQVREAYWSIQRAQVEAEAARQRLDSTRQLAVDVRRRVTAGDLARADQHQADGAVATAEVAFEEARAVLAIAEQRLRALTGGATSAAFGSQPEPLPPSSDGPGQHPVLKEIADRAEVARRTAELARVQRSANPELLLGTTSERAALAGTFENSMTLGVRIPLGSGSRSSAKVASARAEAIESDTQLRLEQDRAAADVALARSRLEGTQAQLVAAERRALLAKESRTFFERSFQAGQTDLPTRLRVELEASEAERQIARFRIELAAAVSALRQALGLLPE